MKIKQNEKKRYKALALTKAAKLLSENKISKTFYNNLLKWKSYDEYEDFYLKVTDTIKGPEYLDLLKIKETIGK